MNQSNQYTKLTTRKCKMCGSRLKRYSCWPNDEGWRYYYCSTEKDKNCKNKMNPFSHKKSHAK